MNPIHPSTGIYDDPQMYQYQNTPDPFDEFLAQLLRDLPIPVSSPSPSPSPTLISLQTTAPTPVPAPAAELSAVHDPLPHPICHWFSQHDPPQICGATLSPDPRHACAHFRHAHDIRGNDKATVSCHWYGCRAAPMQRGSVIRHILSVHLQLLRWRCQTCGRVFSRRGTIHLCGDGDGA